MGVFTRNPALGQRTRTFSGPVPRAVTAGAGSREHSAQPLPYNTVRAITGAAKTINLNSKEELQKLIQRRSSDTWQAEGWEYYDAIGEIKYAFSLAANVLSRVRLYAAKVENPAQAPSEANPDDAAGAAAISALSRLDSAFGGQPGLMRDAGLNLMVPGECYLIREPADPLRGTKESWDIRSTEEVIVDSNGNITLQTQKTMSSQARKKLPKNTYMARIWRPHPRYSEDAESSMRGILDLCSELLLLNRTFRSTARSRLNSGMLYLPDGMSVAANPDVELVEGEELDDDMIIPPAVVDDTTDDDDFEEQLIESMTTPIADEESAAAVVPLLVRGPAELGDKIKLIKFERSFDEALVARSDRVLERIMQGIDVPKDLVTGLANVKYANAIAIDESLYKAHIEPLAVLICDAITVVYIRPMMKAAGINESELNQYVVWYDPSEVTTHPNRSDDADSGYEKHLVSGSAWRKAHGFSDDDAPTPTEIAIRLILDQPNLTPELTEALLNVVAPEVMAAVRAANQAASPAPLPPEVLNALGGQDGGTGQPPPDTAPGGDQAAPAQAPPPSNGSPMSPPRPTAAPQPSSTGQPPLPDNVPTDRLV